MSISERARWLVAAAVLACGTATWAAVLGRAAPHHFIPEQKMAAAATMGDGCLALFGDSRMDAAFNAPSIHSGLQAGGADRCVVNLAIGGTDISGASLALRRYLAGGSRPAAVVVGMAADSLIDPPPLHPENAVGNNAIHLIWTTPADVRRERPDFPAGGIGSWDAAFRFLVAQATPIGRYQSLLWSRVQRIDQRLAGSQRPTNRFGATGDMAQLGAELRRDAAQRITGALARGTAPYGVWFAALRDGAARAGARLVVVELPMPPAYREAVTELPEAARYRQALAADLRGRGASYLDFSHWAGADASAFMDELHLGPPAARTFSRALGTALAAVQPTK